MIDIKKEDIGIQLFSHEMQPAYYLGIKTIFKEKQQAEQLKQQILQNQKLREEIVDAADFYDGKETQIIGKTLQKILDKLGIKDAPKCYSEMLRTDGDRELGRFY